MSSNNSTMLSHYLTTKEAAELLHISTWKLNDLAKQRRIAYRPNGRRRIYSRPYLEKWAMEHEVKAIL